MNSRHSSPSSQFWPYWSPVRTLLLYMLATTQVISTALVVEREEPEHVYKVQCLVYYISKVLFDYETRYN
jgi:hypothetical protein